MATPAQIAANRANALRSTGARTPEGKAASSRNATTHGLAAAAILIPPGKEEAFAALESSLHESLKPSGPLQDIIFRRALESAWKLERCRYAEADLQAETSKDPLSDPALQSRYDRIQRYAREAENSLYKAMRELGKLQTEVEFRDDVFPPQSAAQTETSEVCSLERVVNMAAHARRNEAKTRKAQLDSDIKETTLDAKRLFLQAKTAA